MPAQSLLGRARPLSSAPFVNTGVSPYACPDFSREQEDLRRPKIMASVTEPDASRMAALDALYGAGASSKVAAAKVLVVGAGGVGCELVKNLATSGFSNVTLVDLDTIDVSNLNRQFLFRKQHVGKAKAVTAAQAVEAMVPGFSATGIVANVKEARFSVKYFSEFSVVCNALDNLDARRHVNRMCLAAGTPLVESGSTGYNGQVTVIKKGTECYDCHPKPAPKSYAVCTIRSTPEKPVHCIVWAKHLWDLIFGADDESNVLRDLDGGGAGGDSTSAANSESAQAHADSNGISSDGDGHSVGNGNITNGASNAEGGPNGQPSEAAAVPNHKRKPAKRVRYKDREPVAGFSLRVRERVFRDDIEDQRSMTSLWKKRAAPTVHDFSKLDEANAHDAIDLDTLDLLEQRTWTLDESAAVFRAVLESFATNRQGEIGRVSFDKDDRDALAFVTAASNMRAAAYGVELQSPFSVKGIAGNIVHAIATTNAMVAGLVVLEALKVVTSEPSPGGAHPETEFGDPVTTFVRKEPTGSGPRRRRLALCTESLGTPNPGCYVCSKGMLRIVLDVSKISLRTLVDEVCMKRLGTTAPTINVRTGDYFNTLYECGTGLDDDEVDHYESNRVKTLKELRVEDGSMLDVDDLMQVFSCTLIVEHCAAKPESDEDTEPFVLHGEVPAAEQAPEKADETNAGIANPTGEVQIDDDDVVAMDDEAKQPTDVSPVEAPGVADDPQVISDDEEEESRAIEPDATTTGELPSKKRRLLEQGDNEPGDAGEPASKKGRVDEPEKD